MDEKMIAWAAGLFEGEGTTEKAHPIRIIQKDTWILHKLQELFGGSIILHNANDCYVWSLSGPPGRNLLKQFMPYLSPRRIKQIELASVFNVVRENNTCNKGHLFTPENTQWLKDGYRKCRICRRVAGY